MKKHSASRSAFFNPRILLSLVLCCAAVCLTLMGFSGFPVSAQGPSLAQRGDGPKIGASYRNDISPRLRDMPAWSEANRNDVEHEANENPKIPYRHRDGVDQVIQNRHANFSPLAFLPAPLTNFNGIPYPGVGCNCAPPDTNGAVGTTQYVQIVNEGYQVFDKSGNSLLGPNSISSIWNGFGGACQNGGSGDPVVLYDHLANRWIISQFASATGGAPITDECVAVSTTSDATGSYFRYGFHLGTNFFDYPKLSVWPDAYYSSMNVFNSLGTSYLGPQPFAFDRTKMLQGLPASFITKGNSGNGVESYLP